MHFSEHPMTVTTPILASYEVLRHVAYADRRLSEAERIALADAARARGVPADLRPSRPTDADLDAELARINDRALREETLRAAVALVNVDGYCSDEEKVLLDRIAAAFDLGRVEITAGRAARETPALAAAKAAATERFMRRMSDAIAEGGFTQADYEALVAKMDAEIARV
jgi:hypothetical protein